MPQVRTPRPVVLAILDGFGENPDKAMNAVADARMPVLEALKSRFPHGLIHASELDVGLPVGQMGNSEVGHMNIGSGRVVMQELPRIDRAIADGSFNRNKALIEFIRKLKATGGTCHLMGLLSGGGVHSHEHHMAALVKAISAEGVMVKIHAFLDGRDTPPRSALTFLDRFRTELPNAAFATVSGRYYAMDRDHRWERVRIAWEAISEAEEARYDHIDGAIESSYAQEISDEFLVPCVVEDYQGMKDGDGLLMANFRADRAREILQALLLPEFDGFARSRVVKFAAALGMVEYSTELNRYMAAMFTPEPLHNLLGEVLAAKGLKQLRIAETEKYAHVTFFFNGGREEPYMGESRILVPSPKVATYDLQPEMSAPEVTTKLVEAIDSGAFDFIVVNYANCDMVGHTGSLPAAIKAVETVDACLGRVWAAIERKGGALIVTADHGNAEQMFDEGTHQPHTAHTLNLVPLIVAAPGLEGKVLAGGEGKLADIAPTVLELMGLPRPVEMTGRALI